MSIYDEVKSNIMRQELQLVEAGQHYKIYSAKVKYLPTNIEKPDFFSNHVACGSINLCTVRFKAQSENFGYYDSNRDAEFQ